MSILLTGGAGYIGVHTAVELLREGYRVLLCDNLSNSSMEAVSRVERITGSKIPFYRFDVTKHEDLNRMFAENEIDAVVHFAGFKAVGESTENPLKYYRNNLDTTLTLLEVMDRHDVRNIVFSSSATVYGIPDKSPITEDMRAGVCFNPYGRSKYMNEQILTDCAAANPSLSVVLLRYFNPIGAHESGLIGDDPSGIPNNLMPYISQVAVGKLPKLYVFGNDYRTKDGTGVRDYIHVVDLARGHIAALRYAKTHKGAETFNLGTGVGYSVLDLLTTFMRVNDLTIPYEIAPRRPGDIDEYFGDPGKAGRVLGWRADKTLEDMCRDAWNWQKNNPNGYA